jgi:hypothetical protein
METLELKPRILTQPARLSEPCKIEVRLTNQSNEAVLVNGRLAVTTPTESKTTGTVGDFPHGSRETPERSVFYMEADRWVKA